MMHYPFLLQKSQSVLHVNSNTSTILENYLNFTGQYWSGDDIDFGDWKGGFNRDDVYTEPYTNILYTQYVGTPPECTPCSGISSYLIERNGQCKLNNGQCISYAAGTRPAEAVYVRAGVFIDSEYNQGTNLNLFFNERRDARLGGRHPKEGFADSFSAFIRMGSDAAVAAGFPAEERRRQFFEQCICCWLTRLLSLDLGGCEQIADCE